MKIQIFLLMRTLFFIKWIIILGFNLTQIFFIYLVWLYIPMLEVSTIYIS